MRILSGAGYITVTDINDNLARIRVDNREVLRHSNNKLFIDPNYIIYDSSTGSIYILSNRAEFDIITNGKVRSIQHINPISRRIGNERYSIVSNDMPVQDIYIWSMQRFSKLLKGFNHVILYLNRTSDISFLITVRVNQNLKIYAESDETGCLFLWDQIAQHGTWDREIVQLANRINVKIPNLSSKVNRFERDVDPLINSLFIILALQNAYEEIGFSNDFRMFIRSNFNHELLTVGSILDENRLLRELTAKISEYLELKDLTGKLSETYNTRIRMLKLN